MPRRRLTMDDFVAGLDSALDKAIAEENSATTCRKCKRAKVLTASLPRICPLCGYRIPAAE